MSNLIALPDGTELVGDYRIGRVLGAGGFGITYLADEIALGRPVTIKEYFPSDFAARGEHNAAAARSQGSAEDYRWGLARFIEEAQTLAKFDHPNIVRVYRYFEANNTAYMVLHFEEGQSLKAWLKGLGRAPRQRELDVVVAPLLDALELIHKNDFLHRDIAPDNIMIRKGGAPVLIDFGSARGEIAAHARSKTVSALVKPGYSPYEQYAETSRRQGPWTDIYAMGATLYHAVTGKRPPDAPSRMVKDELVPAREAALSSYRASFLRAIDRALTLTVEGRPQSIAAWRGDLLAPEPAKPGWLGRPADDRKRRPGVAEAGEAGAGVTVPLPDVPGPHGGILDFVDGLRRKTDPPGEPAGAAAAKADAAAPPGAAQTVRIETAPAPPAFLKKKAGARNREDGKGLPEEVKPANEEANKAEPARGDGRAIVPVAAPEPRRKARPKPVKSFERRNLRPLLVKLLIGAGIASAAVALQDRFPRFEGHVADTPPSKTARQSPSHTASIAAIAMPLQTVKAHKGGASFVAYTDDGASIVTAGADATLKVWSTSSGGLARTIELDDGAATSVALFGRRALTGHASGRVALWDLDQGRKVATFRRNEGNVSSLTFAGGPDRFAASGSDLKVALWDTHTATAPAHAFEGHEGTAEAVAYSGRGPYLASGGADHLVKLWNLDTLQLVRTYKGHAESISALAFAGEGRQLASASLDGGIRLWSTSSSRLQHVLRGHQGRVECVAFSPAGDMLASAGDDGTVRLWDARRGRAIKALLGHTGAVKSVVFSPDGKRLASAGADGSVKIWSTAVARHGRE